MTFTMNTNIKSAKATLSMNGMSETVDIPSDEIADKVQAKIDIESQTVEYTSGVLKGTKISLGEYKGSTQNYADQVTIADTLNQKKYKKENTTYNGSDVIKSLLMVRNSSMTLKMV